MTNFEQPQSSMILYQTEDGRTRIQCRFENETIWLTQKLISVLFDKGRSTITEHLKNIFETGELDKKAVCRDFRHTAESEFGKAATCKEYLQVRTEGGREATIRKFRIA